MAKEIHLYGSGRVDVFPFKLEDYEKMIELCLMYRDRNKKGSIGYYRWYRNYMMLRIGCNTGCRIQVLLNLVPKHLNGGEVRIKEFKTNKVQHYNLNDEIMKEIEKYKTYVGMGNRDYFFTAKPLGIRPISRIQAYRIIQKLAKDVGIEYSVGCHSLRKSYGRFLYDEKQDLPLVQRMLDHDNPQVTLQYICLEESKVAEAKKASNWGSGKD